MKMKRLLSCIAFVCCLAFVASSCSQDEFDLQKGKKNTKEKTKSNPDDYGSGSGGDPSISN